MFLVWFFSFSIMIKTIKRPFFFLKFERRKKNKQFQHLAHWIKISHCAQLHLFTFFHSFFYGFVWLVEMLILIGFFFINEREPIMPQNEITRIIIIRGINRHKKRHITQFMIVCIEKNVIGWATAKVSINIDSLRIKKEIFVYLLFNFLLCVVFAQFLLSTHMFAYKNSCENQSANWKLIDIVVNI